MVTKPQGLKICLVGDYDAQACEAAADELISEVEGIYTETQLTRQNIARARMDERVARAVQAQAETRGLDFIMNVAWVRIRQAAAIAGVSRKTLDMVEWRRDGYTYPQIAEEYGLKVDTVRARVDRAIARILDLPEFWLWSELIRLNTTNGCWWEHVFKLQMAWAERRYYE
jgi:DNA-binding NarL/FixJ family response regulator